MTLTPKEICIFHIYNVPPSMMARFSYYWDLRSVYEYHQSLEQGNRLEQAVTAILSVMEVYHIIKNFPNHGKYIL